MLFHIIVRGDSKKSLRGRIRVDLRYILVSTRVGELIDSLNLERERKSKTWKWMFDPRIPHSLSERLCKRVSSIETRNIHLQGNLRSKMGEDENCRLKEIRREL